MDLRDLIVTPLLIIVIYVIAYVVRPYVTDSVTRKYFFPALTLRIIGAIAVGFIYQFYYTGGDTYNYHTLGSRQIWEAFIDSPAKGSQIFFYGPENIQGVYEYTSRIVFLADPGSFTVVRVASLIDLLTFSTYSATAIIFGMFAFIGMWMFFLTFYDMYPHLHKYLAFAAFFIPSVFFWGSGLLKDTITLACLGAGTYTAYQIFVKGKINFVNVFLLPLSLFMIYKIKLYILLTFLPAVIVWIFVRRLQSIRYKLLRFLLFPLVIFGSVGLAYFAVLITGEGSSKYSVENIARTAQITAYDIRYYTGKDAGSGYSLGDLDGTWQSMITLLPSAINVSLFRPYLWEVRNPLMLLSALESIFLFLFTMYVLVKSRGHLFSAFRQTDVLFCLTFSLTFAFAVGVSTYNFGTLTRYKIPLLPFYVVALILIMNYANRERKRAALESTE
jgi:hypothetical protein